MPPLDYRVSEHDSTVSKWLNRSSTEASLGMADIVLQENSKFQIYPWAGALPSGALSGTRNLADILSYRDSTSTVTVLSTQFGRRRLAN